MIAARLSFLGSRVVDRSTGPRVGPASRRGGTRHEQLGAGIARRQAGQDRVAHVDRGFDFDHQIRPKHLRLDLQRRIVDAAAPDDATDRTSGLLTSLGHGNRHAGDPSGAEQTVLPREAPPVGEENRQ
jgi:hypothetical protein